MAGKKVLVLGATGPAGICLLRELVHRMYATVVFARTPSKIPNDLATNPLIEIIQGQMTDSAALSTAMAKCSLVLSLLGPSIHDKNIDPTVLADIYKYSIFPTMHQHGVRRILAMGTLSLKRPEDQWNFFHFIILIFMRLLASAIYRCIHNVAEVFEEEGSGLDWTIFRIAQIPGESDEASWERDRKLGELFTGWVGEVEWSSSVARSGLARWLVDAVEGRAYGWVGKMPAVSWRAGTVKS